MHRRIEVASDIALSVDICGQNTQPTILLSNSIGADLHMWDEFVSLLQDRFQIIRYDTRGHGRSGLGSQQLTIDMLGRDVITILDTLKISRAFICGLSLGGLTAQWLGAAFPERFDGIVLANTAVNFPPEKMWHDRAKTVREQGMQPLLAPTLERWFTKSYRERQPARIAEVSKMIAGTSPEGYARCCEVLAATDLSGTAAKVQKPVRVICGQHDPSTTPARGEELARLIPQADMVTLDAAHISSIEAADEFANAVSNFIERVSKQ